VIAITAYHHLVANARKVGADGALPKGFSKSELVDTIRAVCELRDFSLNVNETESSNELSDREKEILNLMAEGLTDKEIANRLNIAESTAKNHVSNILVKLDAINRTHAVSIGYQKGILK
jgi:DNA-binding NarL/FixJ family response regulator